MNDGGQFSNSYSNGEVSCHLAHHCRFSSVLFWHRRPCHWIFLDRLRMFRDLDRSVGEHRQLFRSRQFRATYVKWILPLLFLLYQRAQHHLDARYRICCLYDKVRPIPKPLKKITCFEESSPQN